MENACGIEKRVEMKGSYDWLEEVMQGAWREMNVEFDE